MPKRSSTPATEWFVPRLTLTSAELNSYSLEYVAGLRRDAVRLSELRRDIINWAAGSAYAPFPAFASALGVALRFEGGGLSFNGSRGASLGAVSCARTEIGAEPEFRVDTGLCIQRGNVKIGRNWNVIQDIESDVVNKTIVFERDRLLYSGMKLEEGRGALEDLLTYVREDRRRVKDVAQNRRLASFELALCELLGESQRSFSSRPRYRDRVRDPLTGKYPQSKEWFEKYWRASAERGEVFAQDLFRDDPELYSALHTSLRRKGKGIHALIPKGSDVDRATAKERSAKLIEQYEGRAVEQRARRQRRTLG